MSTVLLVIHTMIAVVLIGVVLLQRSEGGALGIGGGSGGFMTGRGAANFLTRVTAGLAAGFFATSILLSMIATRNAGPHSVLESTVPGTKQKAPDGESKPSSLPPIDFNMPSGGKGGGDESKVPKSE
jgi:preprotein translocase subunit SecG